MRRVLAAVALTLALALSGCAVDDPSSSTGGRTPASEEQRQEKGPDRQKRPEDEQRAKDQGPAASDKQQSKNPNPKPKPAPKPTQEPKATPKPEPKKRLRTFAVLRVVDGDTVEVGFRGGVSVRIIGIDTPETVSPSVPDECWGGTASGAANNLLGGRRVALRFDPSQGRLDAYGRTLAYLTVPGLGDFGLAMIKRGHAAEYTYDTGYRMRAAYQRAEANARASAKGLWGKCGGPDKPLAPKPEPPPPDTAPMPAGGNCAPGYTPCVPPYPPDVDCADVNGPISVNGSDPHGLDADGDGVACES